MVASIVVSVPAVEIEDGLIHLTWANGSECYWKPKALGTFIRRAQRNLDLLEIASHEPPTLRSIK